MDQTRFWTSLEAGLHRTLPWGAGYGQALNLKPKTINIEWQFVEVIDILSSEILGMKEHVLTYFSVFHSIQPGRDTYMTYPFQPIIPYMSAIVILFYEVFVFRRIDMSLGDDSNPLDVSLQGMGNSKAFSLSFQFFDFLFQSSVQRLWTFFWKNLI